MKAVRIILVILSLSILYLVYQNITLNISINGKIENITKEIAEFSTRTNEALSAAGKSRVSAEDFSGIKEELSSVKKSQQDMETSIGQLNKRISQLPKSDSSSKSLTEAKDDENRILTKREIKELVKAELAGTSPAVAPAPAVPAARAVKKKVTIEDFSKEVGLSTRQENDLRDYQIETENDILTLFLNEGENLEELKDKFIRAKEDPAVEADLKMRLPKLITKLDKVMELSIKQEQKIREILSEEQIAKLQQYDLQSPQGLDMNLEGAFGFQK